MNRGSPKLAPVDELIDLIPHPLPNHLLGIFMKILCDETQRQHDRWFCGMQDD